MRILSTFKARKTTIFSTLLIRYGFKGTVVNRALLSLHGGSLEITLTVPLMCLFSDEFRSCIEALRGHEDKIRIILNKADLVEHQVNVQYKNTKNI